jgi:4-amino-4-deoxy-L-arabinose transferase-like glycosyltransferase
MSNRRRSLSFIALTVLGATAVYLAGNGSVSLFDRDEPRYAQCSRQMLQSGDWVVPRLFDEVRTAKPIFIYWCQAAAMRLLGDNAFAARLPSALAMPVTLIVMGGFVWRAAGPKRAVWTVLLLASSVMVLISAKACLTDSMLLLWVTTGQICIYEIWRGRGTWPVVLTLAVATGLAGLTKGPVVVGVEAATLLALVVLGNTVRPRLPPPVVPNASLFNWVVKGAVAVVVIAAVVGPWLYLLYEREPTFVSTSIGHDVVNRARSGLEKHGGPPGYYMATIWVFFLPWSLLLPLGVVLGWKHRHLPLVRFALAAVVGPWLMFELIRTKLPHYMLPTYPWLALLVADAIVRCLRGQFPDLQGNPFRITVAAWATAVALGGAALPIVTARRFGEYRAAIAVTVAAAVYAAVLLSLLRARRTTSVVATLGAGVAPLWLVGWTIFFPQAQFLRLSVHVADVLKREGATDPGNAIMLDYKEPSLAFYQGGTIRMNGKMELSHDLLDRGPPWLVITDEVWRRTPQDVRQRVQVVAAFKGLSYADEGRTLWVMVVRNVRP